MSAYTSPGGVYPPFINISEQPDGVRFMVRSSATAEKGYPEAGSFGQITIGREVAIELLEQTLEELKCVN